PPEYQNVRATVPNPIVVGQSVFLVCSSIEFLASNATAQWQLQRLSDPNFITFTSIKFPEEQLRVENITGTPDDIG
ncbi:mucin-2, partial [Biomphalaria pfeifferi]